MKEGALGLLEIRGLPYAVAAADIMCKASPITLHKLEKTKGGGWMLVMVTGEVEAVKEALEVGENFARNHSCFIARGFISRMSDGLLDFFPQTSKKD